MKKHILVPHLFTTENLASNFSPEKFPHVTTTERDALLRSGSIEALGDSGRIWRMKPQFAIRGFSARHMGLPGPPDLAALMLTEIRRGMGKKKLHIDGWLSNAIRPFRPQNDCGVSPLAEADA